MSDDEDDYLSDKFLVDHSQSSSSSAPKTYADRRKEALKRAVLKNEQNRIKSRRELEREAREEGLSTSLFERAQEEARESGQQNKALAMMMKMGFRPGQALGKDEEEREAVKDEGGRSGASADRAGDQENEDEEDKPVRSGLGAARPRVEKEAEPVRAGIGARPAHDALETAVKGQSSTSGPSRRTAPLPVLEWEGKKGIGLGKRAASPTAPERLAKMAKMADDRAHGSFRDRAKQEYEERRASGRLHPAQRTCATLDEKAGVQFNVLWLNPDNPDTFPDGLLDALDIDDPALATTIQRQRADHSLEGRIRAKMQADALRPLKSTLDDVDAEDGDEKAALRGTPYSEEDVHEAVQFLRLGAQDRLTLVLDYLRRKYAYCFWCGTQYEDAQDMEDNCPGPDEDAHD